MLIGAINDGHTSLHYAAKYGRLDIVQILLPTISDANKENKYKCTPIMLAVQQSHFDIVIMFAEMLRML